MSSSNRCSQCGRASGSKNLVVCIYTESLVDQFGPSFFHNLFGGRSACFHTAQIVYSTADTGKDVVRQVYGKVCEVYGGKDDRIYLFGIERGADKVLELVQWIEMFGLICPGQDHLLDAAQMCWKDKSSERAKWAGRFKSIHSKNGVRIHFVGTWDSDRQRPEGLRLEHELEKYPVDFYRRVVSIDERAASTPPPPGTEHQTEKQARQPATATPTPAPFNAIRFAEPTPSGRARACPASFRWLALHAHTAGLRVSLAPPAAPQRFRARLPPPPREAPPPPPGRKRLADLLPGRSAANDRSTGSAERLSAPVWCRVDDGKPSMPNGVEVGPSYTVEEIVVSV